MDWAAWGGVVQGNGWTSQALADAGVLGFKCFLIHPGIDGFSMVTEEDLRAALPHVARTGLPLLVHAELAGPIDAATARLANADWRCYSTYLQSRPDEAELSAIRMMLSLCRDYDFRLHIVHLSTALALPELRAARAEKVPVSVETCPHYLHLAAENIPNGATLCKCAPPIRSRENREASMASAQGWSHRSGSHGSFPLSARHEEAGRGKLQDCVGWHCKSFHCARGDVDRGQPEGFTLMDIARWMAEGPARLAGCHGAQGSHCRGLRCGPGCI